MSTVTKFIDDAIAAASEEMLAGLRAEHVVCNREYVETKIAHAYLAGYDEAERRHSNRYTGYGRDWSPDVRPQAAFYARAIVKDFDTPETDEESASEQN